MSRMRAAGVRALRVHWRRVAAGMAVGLLVAGVLTLLLPRTYASTASLYVSASDPASAPSGEQVALLSRQRVTSYADLVRSDRVLAPVVDGGGVGGTTAALADRVTVTSPPGSTVLAVTVTDADPGHAAAAVDAIAGRLVDVVAQLERPQTPGAVPRAALVLVDPGTVDLNPVSPRAGLDLLVGLVVGLLVGAAAAVVPAVSDTTVRTSADLAEALAVPVLGTLPADPAMRPGAVAPVAPGYREAVRRIRANLLFADVDDPPRLLTVAGARGGEGTTTAVCALAAAVAAGGRVCVVEGDLRRPALADRLGLAPTVGLTDVLAHRATLGSATARWAGSGVDVLVAGGSPHNPGELLSSRTMGEVLTELRAGYDLVLLDVPPLREVADGAVLAGRSDGVILLGRQGSTTRAELTGVLAALAATGARVLGGVLTMTAPGPESAAEPEPEPAAGPEPASPATDDPPAVPPVLRRRSPSRLMPGDPTSSSA